MKDYAVVGFGLSQEANFSQEFSSKEEAMSQARVMAKHCQYWRLVLFGPAGRLCTWELNSRDEVVEIPG